MIKDVQTIMVASQDKKHVVRMSRPLQRQKLSELTKQTSDIETRKMKNCFLRKTKENKNSHL